MQLKNNLSTETGWEIIETSFDQGQIATTGSNFLIGNGYLGYRGTFAEWRAEQYTACIVTDTYDQVNGKWKELCNLPNGLYTQVYANENPLPLFPQAGQSFSRTLRLNQGTVSRSQIWKSASGKEYHLETERFASFDQLHLIGMKYCLVCADASPQEEIKLRTGIDKRVWSLQGNHFETLNSEMLDEYLITEARTVEDGILIVVLEGIQIKGSLPQKKQTNETEQLIIREMTFNPEAEQEINLEKYVVIYTSNDVADPRKAALDTMERALSKGYGDCKKDQIREWDRIWSVSDIEIQGNLEDQVLTRFNLYHNIIATPTHAHLPIGARGLSTQVYQGAAFWDQEIFNLPMFIYTQPDVARNILEYRFHTLDGARGKAKRLGYTGAFYAWTSGKTGVELFPDFFFTDVLTGRKIRNHFNDWQIHISPDIVYAVWQYYQATQDVDFLFDHGGEILFEVSRFLYSYAFYKPEKNRFEFIRLLGPDEYHENVDNNAFTNYQAYFALEKTLLLHQLMQDQAPNRLKELAARIQLSDQELDNWKEMVDQLYLPEPDPDTGLIEQFDGYFELEDILPDQLRDRLIDPDEYWGWPNGIAVHTQVLKQADVVQLIALQDKFSDQVIRANYDYYEPRTEHGSSLSPSVHALVACKAGHYQQAYDYFIESSSIDLYQKSKKVFSGGSFLGGIHTAACGAAWWIIVFGFGGFMLDKDMLSFNPHLPKEWKSLTFRIQVIDHQLNIKLDQKKIVIKTISAGQNSLTINVGDNRKELPQKGELSFKLR